MHPDFCNFQCRIQRALCLPFFSENHAIFCRFASGFCAFTLPTSCRSSSCYTANNRSENPVSHCMLNGTGFVNCSSLPWPKPDKRIAKATYLYRRIIGGNWIVQRKEGESALREEEGWLDKRPHGVARNGRGITDTCKAFLHCAPFGHTVQKPNFPFVSKPIMNRAGFYHEQ